MQALFWALVGLLIYIYVGFPLLILLRGWLRPRPYRCEDITPSVSIIIAARNEEATIEAKLENLLALDYPEDQLEVVIASDGSDDRTGAIVSRYQNARVCLLSLPRVGKAEALNAAIACARGELLVFSDANSMYCRDAIRVLVRPLADEAVGGVAGNQVYLSSDGGDASTVGEQRYWDFDRLLKVAQSRSGSVTGATGAIYAIRRALVHPIRGDVNDDLLNSLRVVAQGHRLVFEPQAIAYEPVTETAVVTFARRVRVVVRGLRCVFVMRQLLNPFRYGFFSLQLLSHKVLLRTAAIPLVILAAVSVLLWPQGWIYRAAALSQAVFYALGLGGILLVERPIARHRLLAFPAFFCLVNAATVKALWQLIRGEQLERWEPER
jgi:cellulose synthase/poly-beta-1,6-N-acetylglucosamine synthase-like glycosyltransferase